MKYDRKPLLKQSTQKVSKALRLQEIRKLSPYLNAAHRNVPIPDRALEAGIVCRTIGISSDPYCVKSGVCGEV